MADLSPNPTPPNAFLSAYQDPGMQGLLGLSLGLLAAGGPSRIPVNFGQALAQAGQQATQSMQSAQRDKLLHQQIQAGNINNQILQARANLLNQPTPPQVTPSQAALAMGASQGSVGPTNANAALLDNGQAQQVATQSNQSQGPGGLPVIPGFTPQQTNMAIAGVLPQDYVSAVAQGNQPTDLARMGRELGLAPNDPRLLSAYAQKMSPPIVNRGFGIGTIGPNGQYQPDAASTQQAADTRGAIARAESPFDFVNVTRPDGSVVPVSKAQLSGQGVPAALGQMPSQPVPMGQPTGAKSLAEATGKASSDYVSQVHSNASSAVTQNRMLDELNNNLSNMTPGKLAAVKKSIAQWKVASGVGDDNDKKIAASGEVADKLTGQLVSNALKSMTARPTQAEFQIFLNKFVPNMEMTPQGANAVVGFMRANNNLALQKQQAFTAWKKTQPASADYRDFETEWNKTAASAPLGSSQSFGTSGLGTQQTSGSIGWSIKPIN